MLLFLLGSPRCSRGMMLAVLSIFEVILSMLSLCSFSAAKLVQATFLQGCTKLPQNFSSIFWIKSAAPRQKPSKLGSDLGLLDFCSASEKWQALRVENFWSSVAGPCEDAHARHSSNEFGSALA